jgi:hypothetical protein
MLDIVDLAWRASGEDPDSGSSERRAQFLGPHTPPACGRSVLSNGRANYGGDDFLESAADRQSRISDDF